MSTNAAGPEKRVLIQQQQQQQQPLAVDSKDDGEEGWAMKHLHPAGEGTVNTSSASCAHQSCAVVPYSGAWLLALPRDASSRVRLQQLAEVFLLACS